jgi:hypothetical protein
MNNLDDMNEAGAAAPILVHLILRAFDGAGW